MQIQLLHHVGTFLPGRHAVLSYPVHGAYRFIIMSLRLVTQGIREDNHRNREASPCVTFPFVHLPIISKYSHLRFILIICSRLTDCSFPVVFAPSSYLGGLVPNVCPETADSDGDLRVLSHSLQTRCGILCQVATWPLATTPFPLPYSQAFSSLGALPPPPPPTPWRCDPRIMASSFLRFSRSHATTHHSR
jgi:hypothetical protein